VLDVEFLESSEVLDVDSGEYKSVRMSDAGDLPLHVRGCSTKSLETGSFATMPRGRHLVIRKDRE
jgi:hypothetical protein